MRSQNRNVRKSNRNKRKSIKRRKLRTMKCGADGDITKDNWKKTKWNNH